MNTKRKLTGIAAVGMALIFLSLAATAYEASAARRGWGMRGGLGVMNFRLLKAVDLTEVQEARIREILRDYRETFRTYRRELREVRREINGFLYQSGAVEEADLSPQIERIAEIQKRLTEETVRVALKVRAVLTPEQLAKLVEVGERLRALRAEARELLRRDK